MVAERTSPVKDPAIDGLRALHLARNSAVKARTAAINRAKAIMIMAPEAVRVRFRGLTTIKLMRALLRVRVFRADPGVADTLAALKVLAQRHRDLSAQIAALTARIDPLATTANPALRAAFGVGAIPRHRCLSPLAIARKTAHLPSHRSRRCVASLRSQPHPARPVGTDSPAAAIAAPTTPFTASRWSACSTTNRPSTTSAARPTEAARRRKNPADVETCPLPRDLPTPHQTLLRYPSGPTGGRPEKAQNLTLTAAAQHFGRSIRHFPD